MIKPPDDNNRSLVEECESVPSGAQGLAAARLALHMARLLRNALAASGLSQKELAAIIGVSDGRVSQVMNGDGNVHIATLARFMRAMGYELDVHALPLIPGRTPIHGEPVRRTRPRPAKAQTDTASPEHLKYDLYEQTFVTGHGPLKVPMFVPTDDVLGCAPEGAPYRVGRVRIVPAEGSGTVARRAPRSGTWRVVQPQRG